MNIQTNPLLMEAKYKFHQCLSLASGLIILFFCFFNIVMLHQLEIGIVQAILGSLNLYFFWSANQKKTPKWHFYMLMSTITISILYVFHSADLRAGSIYWLILLPPIYCILAGPKTGLIYTIILSIPALSILFIKSDVDTNIHYRSAINFTLAYFLSYLVCYFYAEQYTKNSILLQQMAFKDSLTGAQNRHALKLFFDHFNQQEKEPSYDNENTQLVLIDIDHFKSVNDKFGHDIGDLVLAETADLLQDFEKKTPVYRIGGEEFLIILNCTYIEAFNFAEMIRKRIESHIFRSKEHKIALTVSIGVAQLSTGKTYKDFLREADQNLYSAKNEGRNRVYHSSLDD